MATAQRQRPAQRAQSTKLATADQQAQDQAALTIQQSTQVVKTLIETSLGCLTYLRGIFPDDNFEDATVPSGRVQSLNSNGTPRKTRGDGSIKVKKIRKGFSKEGDQLLRYWEEGVQDALERQYLASLIVAIYLDPENPQNIVEAYTFNFSYCASGDSQKKVPMMELTDQMRGIKILSNDTPKDNMQKVMPTARDVRSSVQSIVRALITLTQSLTDLPRRRFMSLKLSYTAETPEDYEPPCFSAADPEKHRFVFGTKQLAEGPDEVRIGHLDTGHHGVGLHIASLAHLLPPSIASTMDEKSQRVTIADKIARRRHDDEAQIRDAEERVVLWDAEERADNLSDMADSSEADGEGEEDPSLVAEQSDEWREQNKRSERVGLARDKKGMPLGLRLQDGRIIPVPPTALQEAKRRRAAREQGEDVDGEDVEDVEMFVAKGVRREWNENTNADLKQNMISQPFSIGETQPIDGFGSMPSAQMPPSTQRHGGVGMGPPSRPANRANEASSSVFPLSSIPESLMEEPDDPIQHQASNQHTLAGFNDFPDLPLQEETTQQRAEQENASQGITDAEMEDIDGEELQDEEVKGGDAGSDGGRAASEDPISSFPSQALPANPAASNDAEVESIQATQSQQIDTTSQARRQTRSSRRRSSDIVSSSAEITTQSPSKNAPQPAATAEPAQAEEIVACDCDDLVTDGLMIQCEVCEFWLHAACYGYTNVKTVPDDFRCYAHQYAQDDVLQSSSQERVRENMLAELKSLALMRRALHVLYAEGLPDTVTAFAKRIGADASTASRIRADCQTEGFLKEDTPVDNNHTGTSQRSHKKGAAKKVRRGTAKAKLVVNKSYEMRKLKNERYFRPGEGREKEITLSWNKVAQTAEEESAQSVDVSMADAAQGRENATPSNMSANCKDGPSDEQEGRDHIDTPAEAEAVDQSAATHGDGQPEAQPEMNESIEESMLMLTPEQQRHGANLSAGMMTPAATEPRAPPALIETAGRSTHTSPAGPSSEKAPPATPVKPTFKPIFGRKGKGRAQDTEMANHFMTGSALAAMQSAPQASSEQPGPTTSTGSEGFFTAGALPVTPARGASKTHQPPTPSTSVERAPSKRCAEVSLDARQARKKKYSLTNPIEIDDFDVD